MRYRLRTLVILTAVGPPLLALAWFTLPLIFVQAILISWVVSMTLFAAHWSLLAQQAAEVKANRIRMELNEQRRDNRT